MPGPDVATLDARIEAALQARRPALAELVRQAVDRELAALVDAELEQRLNGRAAANGTGDAPGESAPVAAPKTCRVCGLAEPVVNFARQRRVCRRCRETSNRARQREREAAGADDGPRPEPEPHEHEPGL